MTTMTKARRNNLTLNQQSNSVAQGADGKHRSRPVCLAASVFGDSVVLLTSTDGTLAYERGQLADFNSA